MAPHDGDQFFHTKGFGKVIIHAGRQAAFPITIEHIGRNDRYGQSTNQRQLTP